MKAAKRLDTVKEYYFSEKLREVKLLMAQGKPIINMGVGSPDLPPPPQAVRALQDSLTASGAHQYQSYQGLPELRKAIASFYKTFYGVALDSQSEILPLMGSKEGIMHVSMAYLNPGDEVLIPNPGYPTYSSVTELVGANPRYYYLKEKQGWLPDLKALTQQNLSKVKLMWINFPHMPTGAIASDKLLYELVNFAKENNILLVNDNPYSFILTKEPKSILNIPDAKEVALELNSLSKAFNMSGWRVGMALGSADKLNHLLKVKSNMDSGMFYGLQQGAIAALQADERWFEELNSIYEQRRDLVWKMADLLNCTYSKRSAGLFVWAKLPNSEKDSEKFVDRILYEKNIFITPGTVFGTEGQGYIRFSLCVDEIVIREAIHRL